MGGRPKKPFEPLLGYTATIRQDIRSSELLKVIYKKALAENRWIYDSKTKRWFTPEEFWEIYQRYDNIDQAWIDALQIRDPGDGLKAADQQIESILSRKAIFAQKIIDYWKAKRK